jgi:hypothetical protein
MGVISNPEMITAVSEAGGFCLLATAFAPITDIVGEIRSGLPKNSPELQKSQIRFRES